MRRKNLFLFFSFLFFIFSFSLLFLKENNLFLKKTNFSFFIPQDLLIEDTWYGVYFQNTFIGFSHFFMKVQDINEGGGYLLENKTRLNLPVLGYIEPVNLHMRINLFDNYSLKKAFLNLRSESYFLKGELKKIKNDLYSLHLETPLQKIEKSLFIKEDLINSLFLPISFNFLPLKKKVTFYVYDPFLEKKMKITLFNKGRRTMKNFKEKAYLIEMDVEGVKGKLYVDYQGRLLYEEFLGFKFIKEEPRLLFSKKTSSSIDIAQILAIETEKLPEPEKLHYLKVKIRGIKKEWIREDFNQKVSFEEKEAIVEITKKIPAQKNIAFSPNNFQKYLKEDKFIRFNNSLLQKTVSSIVKNEKNPLEILKKLFFWINKNIKKTPTFSIPNTLDALKSSSPVPDSECPYLMEIENLLARMQQVR